MELEVPGVANISVLVLNHLIRNILQGLSQIVKQLCYFDCLRL